MRITEVFKKSDVERADNYRPLCYAAYIVLKCFQTLLCNRLYNKLDRRQPPDQGGFRRSLQTLDHEATYSLSEQKMPRVASQDVDRDGRLRKGVRYDTSQRTMECPWKIRS